MNIYVGNITYDTTAEDLQEMFTDFGKVESVKIIRDKFSGESKGFGFVEMLNNTEAKAAMEGITIIKGRSVVINEARPQASGEFANRRRDTRNRGPKGGRTY